MLACIALAHRKRAICSCSLFRTTLDQAIAHMLLTSEGSFKKEIKKLPDPDLLSKAPGTIQKVNTLSAP